MEYKSKWTDSVEDNSSNSDSIGGDMEIDNNELLKHFKHINKSNFPNKMSLEDTSTSTHCFKDSNYKVYDDELESIIQKYSTTSTNTTSKQISQCTNSELTTIELSSDEELPQTNKAIEATDVKELHAKYYNSLYTDTIQVPELPSTSKTISIEKETVEKKGDSTSRKRKCGSSSDKEKLKQEKAAQKMQKREDLARVKKVKQALSVANKNIKPEECMKFITVNIDNAIIKEKYGGEILNSLQAIEVGYELQGQLIPNTITWTRKIVSHSTDAKGDLIENVQMMEADEVLLIINWTKIVELIHTQTLNAHVESIKSILDKNRLCLAIYGLENYFRYHKQQKQKEIRYDVSQTVQKTSSKSNYMYQDLPKIEKKQLELSLTELQILHSCCYRLIENPQDLGGMIAQFTKSIAETPYKLEKHQKQQQADWYMSGDNKDCVKVDKNGNGLKRLWQQQLTTFPLARLEHAEAIVAKYPTFTGLIEESKNSSVVHGENFLEDLPIRRAAGPLTSARRLGIELSKKINTFFTSMNGDDAI